MLKQAIMAAAITASALLPSTAAHAYTTGYTYNTSNLPTVTLPQRYAAPVMTPSQTATTAATQAVSPTAQTAPDSTAQPSSTAVTRNGGSANVRDNNAAPDGALKAAAASGQAPVQGQTAAQTTQAQNKYFRGMVLVGKAKVYDGHSLTVGDAPVRLNGIDAPGLAQLCTTKEGTSWKCGEAAYDRLSSLLDGTKITCVVDSPVGKDAAAATCDGARTQDIGKLLVQEGLAIPNFASAGKYGNDMYFAAGKAKGLWVGPFVDPAKWRKAHGG